MKLPTQLQNEVFNFIPLKGKDPSFNGKGWQNQLHSYFEVQDWFKKDLNYGVMAGFGDLIIIDADSIAVIDVIENSLPATFTVKTGSGKRHYYYFCPNFGTKIIFDDDITPSLFEAGEDHYGEILTKGFQAVGPGSIHPDTKKPYKVFKNLPIATVDKETVIRSLSTFITPPTKDIVPSTHTVNPTLDSLRVEQIIPISKTGNIIHPIHGATNGGNLNLNLEKNLWHCFRCNSGGGPLSLLAVMERIVDCSEVHPGTLRGKDFAKTLEIAEKKYLSSTLPASATTAPVVKTKATTLSSLMETSFPTIPWKVDKLFETGTLNMISAPPNNWKSWFVLQFALDIAAGVPVFGKFATEQSKVMIINEEDSYRSMQDRFRLLGTKNADLPIFLHVAKGMTINKEFVKDIISECEESGVTVLFLDSLRSLHQALENDSTEMQVILDYLKEITRSGITVVFTHHHKKKNVQFKSDDTEMFRGSTAILAALAGYISLEEEVRDDRTVVVVKHLKSKSAEKVGFFEINVSITRNADGDPTAIAFTDGGEFKTFEKKTIITKDVIMKMLSDGSWKSKKDFLDGGIAGKRIIDGALKILTDEKIVISLTRLQAERKFITVGSKGDGREKIYSLNTEVNTVNKDFENF